jgi:hypothetical protein
MVRANTAEGDGLLAFKYLFQESGGGKDSVIALISDDGDAHVQHGALVSVHGRDSLVCTKVHLMLNVDVPCRVVNKDTATGLHLFVRRLALRTVKTPFRGTDEVIYAHALSREEVFSL